jgi:hypothetical protein
VEFGGWKLNEPAPAETFTYQNKSNAMKVEFRTPGQAKADALNK